VEREMCWSATKNGAEYDYPGWNVGLSNISCLDYSSQNFNN
jgi:hypothetical protein